MELKDVAKYEGSLDKMVALVENEIKTSPVELCMVLSLFKATYLSLPDKERGIYYRETRDLYNKKRNELTESELAVLFIFLANTCSGGVYKEDENGLFKVPRSKAKNPEVYNSDKIAELSQFLNEKEKAQE